MSESFPRREAETMLQMSPSDFDQTPNGWRKLQDGGDYLGAADLIAQYLEANKNGILSDEGGHFEVGLLYFHRGQMLATIGPEKWEQAIEAFKHSFQDTDECWNAYVSATIAFLEGDTKRIEEAIQTIETSKQEEKRAGNIGIVKNFKKALEEGIRDYQQPYSWPRAE